MTNGKQTSPSRLWHYILQDFARSSSGAIAVELACLSPFALLLLLGITEMTRAINHKMTLQAATRAGVNLALVSPPVQGDLTAVTAATRAVIPSAWLAPLAPDSTQISANLICQCELSGPIACGTQCGVGERTQTYVKVDVTKNYVSLVKFPDWSPNFVLSDTSIVRLQ